MNELSLRKEIIATALAMNSLGINRGKSGNVSARWKDGFLITPSGLPYEETRPADIVFVDRKGQPTGKRPPSSEWRFHQDIHRTRKDVQAVVHAHSSFATALACLGMDVPAFHYMIAVAGGNSIRCAPYATFGTQELSDHALKAMADRKACLLANHGMITTGNSLKQALALAVEVEALCEQYWRAVQIGQPAVLSDAEMETVLEKFKTYGIAAEGRRAPR
ncbi:MAG TPA: L-fuculose-phosphate aldolase [Burkholderiales bacterium]|nr:L-fuculose-phosphate aldolase [Burkholderiales bacterium]